MANVCFDCGKEQDPIGWVILNVDKVPQRTGGWVRTSKLYKTESTAKAAIKAAEMKNVRVVPVFVEAYP